MNKKTLRIAEEILKAAEDLIFADSDYIYDPDHKKKPGGSYHKTEKGWSKKEEKKEKKLTKKEFLEKKLEIPSEDIEQTIEAEKYLRAEVGGKRVRKKDVQKELGNEKYWSLVHRAAFHATSATMLDDGRELVFDCYNYFRS